MPATKQRRHVAPQESELIIDAPFDTVPAVSPAWLASRVRRVLAGSRQVPSTTRPGQTQVVLDAQARQAWAELEAFGSMQAMVEGEAAGERANAA